MMDCECQKDSDGQCGECREKMLVACQALMGIFRNFLSEVEALQDSLPERLKVVRPLMTDECPECTDKYIDLSLSKLFCTLEDTQEPLAYGVMMGIRHALAEREITAMPMSDKAWTELCARKGWRKS